MNVVVTMVNGYSYELYYRGIETLEILRDRLNSGNLFITFQQTINGVTKDVLLNRTLITGVVEE